MALTPRMACHIGIGLGLIAAPLPAMAQTANPVPMAESGGAAACSAPVAATGVLAPWGAPAPVTAGTVDSAAPVLAPGRAVTAALAPTPQVTYPLRPEKPGGAVSHGGLLALQIDAAGTYRIALGSPAWIDLVRDGQPVISTAHGHGPDCTGIRKMVDFPLQPGRYLLQVSASGAPAVEVLVVRLP